MFNSEEEDDEDNKSCHSSSSDTLTCSIPEVNLANSMLRTLSTFLLYVEFIPKCQTGHAVCLNSVDKELLRFARPFWNEIHPLAKEFYVICR